MSRRTTQLIAIIVMIAALSGCLASAQTANLYTEEEMAVRAEAAPALAEAILEITPNPTKQVTPFLPTASPTPPPTIEPTPSPTLSPTPASTYIVEKLDDKKAYLNAGSANLRTGPGTDYAVVKEIEENTKLTVTGTCGDWFRVETGEDTGFILAEFIEFGAVPTAKPTSSSTPKPAATSSSKPTASAAATQTPSATPSGSNNGSFSDANGYTADELLLIAQVVHQEAKGTSLEAQAAVANVIYNRIRSSRFPNTVQGVIFQKNQFSVASDESELRAVKPSSTAVEAVKQIFVAEDTFLPSDVMYFRSASKGTTWSSSFKYYATYGGNCFFIYIG